MVSIKLLTLCCWLHESLLTSFDLFSFVYHGIQLVALTSYINRLDDVFLLDKRSAITPQLFRMSSSLQVAQEPFSKIANSGRIIWPHIGEFFLDNPKLIEFLSMSESTSLNTSSIKFQRKKLKQIF